MVSCGFPLHKHPVPPGRPSVLDRWDGTLQPQSMPTKPPSSATRHCGKQGSTCPCYGCMTLPFYQGGFRGNTPQDRRILRGICNESSISIGFSIIKFINGPFLGTYHLMKTLMCNIGGMGSFRHDHRFSRQLPVAGALQVRWNDQTTITAVQTITTSPAFKVASGSETNLILEAEMGLSVS